MQKKAQNKAGFKPLKVELEGTLANGKKITPETLGIEKFARLFQTFRKLISASMADNSELLKHVNFQYKKGSAVLQSDVPADAHRIVTQEVRQIEAGHPINHAFSGIAKTLLELRDMARDIGQGAKITIGGKGEDYIEITENSQFEQLKNTIVETESVVYGKLYSVGGKVPNIHLSPLAGGENIVINVSEEEAKELANSLYDVLGVRVNIRQDILTREIFGAEYIGRIPFTRKLDEEKFSRDKAVGRVVWAGIDPVAWEKEQRG